MVDSKVSGALEAVSLLADRGLAVDAEQKRLDAQHLTLRAELEETKKHLAANAQELGALWAQVAQQTAARQSSSPATAQASRRHGGSPVDSVSASSLPGSAAQLPPSLLRHLTSLPGLEASPSTARGGRSCRLSALGRVWRSSLPLQQ